MTPPKRKLTAPNPPAKRLFTSRGPRAAPSQQVSGNVPAHNTSGQQAILDSQCLNSPTEALTIKRETQGATHAADQEHHNKRVKALTESPLFSANECNSIER